jgi:ABC-type multidrug transport system ATPase subunit
VTGTVIDTHDLRKEFRRLRGGRTIALAGLDLSVPHGGVFGFLGPNGAGKTTTIRCLLGLVRPTAGRCRILGADSESSLARVIGRIGSIVETPALFPTLSGRRNLQLLGGIQGIGPDQVDRVLDQVGLGGRARDLVKTYSQGMRQRLGIASALLKDPEVLILDEPANGLDPAGIKEVRELLRRLGDEGRTIFLSSHILSEVQHVCDRVAIVNRGRTVAAGPVHEVLARGRAAGLVVGLDDLQAGLAVLGSEGISARLEGERIMVDAPQTEAARVTRVLAERGLYVTELRPEEISLEDVFLELTGEQPGQEPR